MHQPQSLKNINRFKSDFHQKLFLSINFSHIYVCEADLETVMLFVSQSVS